MDHSGLPFYEFRCDGHTGIVMLDWNTVCDFECECVFVFAHYWRTFCTNNVPNLISDDVAMFQIH